MATATTPVTEALRAEHRELAPHLDELREVAASVGAWSATVTRLHEVVRFIRDHLLSHAAAEEAVLYPAVERAMGAPGAMDTMIADHRDIARRIEALVDSAAKVGPAPARAEEVEDLKGQLYGLWAILRLHFAKEEEVLLPVLDAALTPAEARGLFDEMSHEEQLMAAEPHGSSHGPSIFNSVVATFTVVAMAFAFAALFTVVIDDGNKEVVAAGGAFPAGGSDIDFDAEAAEDFKPFDPTLQPAPGGTEHTVTIRATETELEIAPGVTQTMWTFDDQVPGPVLRGKVGDIFTVTLVNDGELGHSIDFHASKVAWDDEMRTIGPGESLVYQFQAKHSGIWMYHCGTPPALHHIGNGMYGTIIIDPPDLAPADHEFVFVQSELYLDGASDDGLDKMAAEAWDAVVFNGYVNQYRDRPIRVEPGQRVRAWVMNDGPSENSSFHVVGTIFDTVYKEGQYLLQPGTGGSQALDLQPAQGGFVEFTFDEQGLYPIVTHKFANVGKGALGLFQAGELREPAAGGGGGH